MEKARYGQRVEALRHTLSGAKRPRILLVSGSGDWLSLRCPLYVQMRSELSRSLEISPIDEFEMRLKAMLEKHGTER
jgi:hypothetical protein